MKEKILSHGNTVGSLTQQQRSVIIGCVLGDGYLRKLEGRKDAFLEVNHSIKAKDYVDWKYRILENICQSKPKIRKIGEGRIGYRFFTKQHPEITEIYEAFYKGKRKEIPKGFKLDFLELAVWFMDDGSRTKRNDFYLNSQQFDLKSQRRLLHALRLLKIRARLNKDKKYYRIRILKESIPYFIEKIRPFIIPPMRYKIGEAKN